MSTPTSLAGSSDARLVPLEAIRAAVDRAALVDDVAAAFVAYSAGRAVVPPVGHIRFAHEMAGPAGDIHIKSGYVIGDDVFAVKVASGFPALAADGGSPNDGVILAFERRTGALAAVLLDRGELTDLRTAAAGAVAARALATGELRHIAIFGTGVQARLQLELLELVTPCRAAGVWGRRRDAAEGVAAHAAARGWRIVVHDDPDALAAGSDLIVTTTARTVSDAPLFAAASVRPRTHVTAVGADAPGKRELDPVLLARADVLVVDSVSQCADHGELRHALDAGLVDVTRAVELGAVLAGTSAGRTHRDQITVADLTGVGVQDVAVARHVVGRLARSVSPEGA